MWTGLFSQCRIHFDTMIDFGQNNPNFLIIQTIHKVIEYHEMTDTIIIDNRTHFVSKIKINDSSYFIDRVVELLPAFDQIIITLHTEKIEKKLLTVR
jgi:archaellum biogenesis ATPase FlaH